VALSEKSTFFIKNLTRGLLWLGVIIVLFVLFNHYVDTESSEILIMLGNNPTAVFLVYFISEVIVGIIPPEMFMMWSLELTQGRNYIVDVAMLTAISYLAGVSTYYFGRYFHRTLIYRYLRRRYLGKFEDKVNRFGGFLLFVAAVTPVPYSGICMLMGAVHYSQRNFFLVTLFRILRFVVYGYIMWRASLL